MIALLTGPLVRRTHLASGTLLLTALACADEGDTSASHRADKNARRQSTSVASLLADSAAADSIALANLPQRLRPDFDLSAQMTPEALADSMRAYCQPLSDTSDAEVRRRLRGRWEGWITVLFVRADRETGELRRVELVRRPENGTQRGYIWDGASDETTGAEWPAGRRTPDTYAIPAGTPTPRALRALGRRLLTIPCTGNPPM